MKILFLLPLIVVSLWGCTPWEGSLPENILARVDGEPITLDDFEREFKELILEPGRGMDQGDQIALKEACLNQMIERRLLIREARRLGIRVSQDELDQAVQEIKKDYPGQGFDERLNLRGITLEGLKVQLEEELLAEKMVRTALQYQGKIDEEETSQFFRTHHSLFELNPKARVRQIVVSDGEEALQILKRLKNGEKFEKLALEKSLGPEKVKGGDLGYFSKGEKPEEFDRVFTMEPGTVSEVIRSPYGYHIFKVEARSEPRSISFEEARPRILQELRRKKGEEEYRKWLKDLKEKARVKINTKRLNS